MAGRALRVLGHDPGPRDHRPRPDWRSTSAASTSRPTSARWSDGAALFIPAYLAASLLAWYRGGHYYLDNWFERDARRACGERD